MTIRTSLALVRGGCHAALDDRGFVTDRARPIAGAFLHDTRHVSLWRWTVPELDLVHERCTADALVQHWSRFDDHAQTLLVRRELALRPDGLDDALSIVNESFAPATLRVGLEAEADFRDLFELRGRRRTAPRREPERTALADGFLVRYRASDGVECETRVTVAGLPAGGTVHLAPGTTHRVVASARFASTLEASVGDAALGWSAPARALRERANPALAQAFDDLDALAAPSAHGTVALTGVPNFATVFGRDGLITARFLMRAAPGLAAATLRTLAEHRGRADDPMTEEEPGRIAHELRVSELARTRDVPFGRYYGTHDANALFLWTLADHADATGDGALAHELEPAWRAALGWIERSLGEDGLLRYRNARRGQGLVNTSWKDSDDSMSHADGTLARGALAVLEVQGYLVPAFEAAARLERSCGGDEAEAVRLDEAARAMRERIEARFWSEALGLHAVALDGEDRPLEIATSNPGHLLWAGALSRARAEAVAARLLEDDLWSGWGLRTLSTRAPRYAPLSYHNGSVWPHDTAIFAAGLARYGLHAEARRVLGALEDAATVQPGHRLPELFGGYARTGPVPPLGYVETCRPQAWASAGLIGVTMDVAGREAG